MVSAVLDSILLFAFSIPIVMQYRILPVEGTPYWLFGVLFLIVSSYSFISVYPPVLGTFKKYADQIKLTLAILAICISLGGALVTAMFDRAKTAPVYGVHDIILQQEAAMRYLITGKNPYKETYFKTPVESFHYAEIDNDHAVNPALYHFVMPPWYLLFPFPFYFVSNHTLGFFDGREVSLFLMGMLLVFVWFWFRDKAIARIAIILTALSPATVNYFIEGRSDIFALAWLVGALVLLERKQHILSAVFFALSLLSKQTIWFIVPFLGVYLWQTVADKKSRFFMYTGLVLLICALLVVPFLAWDARAFIDSVILYLTGNSVHSYPVSGYGFGMVLYEFGVIKNIHAYYPFLIWQIAFALPLFILLIKWLMHKPTQARLMISYAVFLMVYWYFSRYFNNSHLGYLSSVFVLGGLKAVEEEKL